MLTRNLRLAAILIAISACTAETVTVAPAASGNGEETPSEDTSESTDPTEPTDDDDTTDAGKKPDAAKPDASKPDSSTPCTKKRWYRDSDYDTYGDPATFQDACDQPSGYVADNTDCDDTKSAVKPGGVELCDTIDNNCDGTINGSTSEAGACTAKNGSYTGTFSLYTAEKLGSTIVNQMKCTGTTSISIALSGPVVVKGTATCSYPGSLGGFAKTQTSTIEATVRPDGALEGTIKHKFDSFDERTFPLKGTAVNNQINVTQNTTWLPHPMSAVPWEVTITIAATK